MDGKAAADQLTATTFTAPAIEVPPTVPTPRDVAPRTKPRRISTYDKTGSTIAYIASFGLGAALWLAGAYFTIVAARAFNIPTGPFIWLLPLAITTVELWLMPRRGVGWQSVAIFLVILGFDVLTSWYGLVEVMAGRRLPLGAGWTVPQGGAALHVGAIILGLGFAFLPEKLGRWAAAEVWGLWR